MPLLLLKISKKINKKNLRWLTWIQSQWTWGTDLNPIHALMTTDIMNKNRHPYHNLPKTCRGRNSVCTVCIRNTENLLTQPRISLRINERWYNKYDIKKSTINKRRLEQRTWWRFFVKQGNKLKRTILNTQTEPSSRPSKNMWGKQTCMSSLDTAHRKFSNKTEENFQYQWTLIWSMQKNQVNNQLQKYVK